MAQRSVSITKDALSSFENCLLEAETKGGPFLRDRVVTEAIQLMWISLPKGGLCNQPRGIKSDPERPGSTLYEFAEGSYRGSYSACAAHVTILEIYWSDDIFETDAIECAA